jgi:hypothetical protein
MEATKRYNVTRFSVHNHIYIHIDLYTHLHLIKGTVSSEICTCQPVSMLNGVYFFDGKWFSHFSAPQWQRCSVRSFKVSAPENRRTPMNLRRASHQWFFFADCLACPLLLARAPLLQLFRFL